MAGNDSATVYLETGLDEAYFTEQVNQVLDTFTGEEQLDLHIFIFTDPEECVLLVPNAPAEDRARLVSVCGQVDTSLATTISDRSYVFINASQPFLTEHPAAFRGLFAHELMHVVDQFAGEEEEIQGQVEEQMERFVDQFRMCGIGEEKCVNLVQDIVDTVVYAVKDVFVNTELIRKGFESDLQEYYYQSIAAEDTCPMPTFYGEEKDVEEVAEAIAFDISLVPAWLPFEASTSLEAVKVFERIQSCYEANIPRVAEQVDELRDVYRVSYQGRGEEKFIARFLDQVTAFTAALLKEQITDAQS